MIGEAVDGESAVALAERRRPDLIVMDLRMGGIDGVEATAPIRREPALPRHHLHRPAERNRSAAAARRVPPATCSRRPRTRPSCGPSSASRSGGEFVDPALATSLVASDREALLTNREREILQLLADGMSNGEVAKKLFISQETIKSHVRHILAKLEADTRTQAVAIALREAIIE